MRKLIFPTVILLVGYATSTMLNIYVGRDWHLQLWRWMTYGPELKANPPRWLLMGLVVGIVGLTYSTIRNAFRMIHLEDELARERQNTWAVSGRGQVALQFGTDPSATITELNMLKGTVMLSYPDGRPGSSPGDGAVQNRPTAVEESYCHGDAEEKPHCSHGHMEIRREPWATGLWLDICNVCRARRLVRLEPRMEGRWYPPSLEPRLDPLAGKRDSSSGNN